MGPRARKTTLELTTGCATGAPTTGVGVGVTTEADRLPTLIPMMMMAARAISAKPMRDNWLRRIADTYPFEQQFLQNVRTWVVRVRLRETFVFDLSAACDRFTAFATGYLSEACKTEVRNGECLSELC